MVTKDEETKLDILIQKIDELKMLMEAKFAAHLSFHAKQMEEQPENIIELNEVEQNASVKSKDTEKSSKHPRKKVLSVSGSFNL